MKTFLSLAAVAAVAGSLGLTAIPAVAADANSAPRCESSSGIAASNAANIVDELQSYGAQIISTDNWNGCFRAIYKLDGKTEMVFFNPDSLTVVSGTMPRGV